MLGKWFHYVKRGKFRSKTTDMVEDGRQRINEDAKKRLMNQKIVTVIVTRYILSRFKCQTMNQDYFLNIGLYFCSKGVNKTAEGALIYAILSHKFWQFLLNTSIAIIILRHIYEYLIQLYPHSVSIQLYYIFPFRKTSFPPVPKFGGEESLYQCSIGVYKMAKH